MRYIIPLLVFAACADQTADTGHDTVGDTNTPDTSDTVPDTSDTVPDTGDTVPDTSDTSDTADTTPDTDLGPTDPREVTLALDWALQSSHSPQSWFGWPRIAKLDDESLVILGVVNGTLQIGGHQLDFDVAPYVQVAMVRVTPDGDVATAQHFCDRCFGNSTALTPLSGGRFAFASVVNGNVVLAPNTAAEVQLQAEHELLIAIVAADGTFERWGLVGKLSIGGDLRALATAPEGGFVIAGHTQALSIEGGPSFVVGDGWHYPGRAFFVVVDATLQARYAEQLGGTAGSTIGLVHVVGNEVVTVGDFGGYPRGVTTTFGPDAFTLESVSSDDDPAMDLFVARWRLPSLQAGDAPTRPTLRWAQRFAHYQNDARQPTWIRSDSDGIELRVDNADRLEADPRGDWRLPNDTDYGSTIVLRLAADGTPSVRFAALGPVEPAADGFVSIVTRWPGSSYTPSEDGPTFTVPSANLPNGVKATGGILARWREDGALTTAGMLLIEMHTDYMEPTLQAVVPLADGSVYAVLHGSSPVTLAPSQGDKIPLLREPNYERLIVTRARLAAP